MEQVSQIALRSASALTRNHSGELLSDAEFLMLHELMLQMATRYPHQDLSESLEGFQQDTERLAVRFGIRRVQAVMAEFRIKPGQKFFPHPSEIAEALEVAMANERAQFLKDHPYTPCGECHFGDVVVRREDGSTCVVKCECYRAWKRGCEGPSEEQIKNARAAGQ